MKCYKNKNNHLTLFVLLLLSIVLINSALSKSTTENENSGKAKIKTETETEIQGIKFNEAEAKRYAKFAKMPICAKRPLKKYCKKCLKPTSDGFKMFFFFEYKKSKNISYKFFIHYNDKLKKIVISFGAPSVSNHVYFKRIYTSGLVLYKIYKIRIEKEFKKIYFKKLRKDLVKKVKKIMKSGRKGHQFVFTGYSLGASIAVLASYDLTKKKLINKKVNNPTVFTYGGLRIGDSNFINLVNKTVTLWKIVKQNDYVVRTPNCYYSIFTRTWKCYTTSVLRRIIYTRRFPLRRYYIRYIRPIYLRRRVLLMRKRSFLENNSEIKSLVNERNSKISLGEKLKSENTNKKAEVKNTNTNKKTNIKNKSLNKAKNTKMETKSRSKFINNNNKNTNENPIHVHRVYRTPVMRTPVMRRRVIVRRLHTPTFRRTVIRKKMFNVNYYFRYIYYSQPLGTQIFYNASMTSFRICTYVNGVSSCELKFKLPSTFSSTSHNTYYNIDFSRC